MSYQAAATNLKAAVDAGAPAFLLSTPVAVEDLFNRIQLVLHPTGRGSAGCRSVTTRGLPTRTVRDVIATVDPNARVEVCRSCTGRSPRVLSANLRVLSDVGELLLPLRQRHDKLVRLWDRGNFTQPASDKDSSRAWEELLLTLSVTRASYRRPQWGPGLLQGQVAEVRRRDGLSGRWLAEQVDACLRGIDEVVDQIVASRGSCPGQPRRFIALEMSPGPNRHSGSLWLGDEPVTHLPRLGYPVFAVPFPPGTKASDFLGYDLGPADGWSVEELDKVLPAAERMYLDASKNSPLRSFEVAMTTARDVVLGG